MCFRILDTVGMPFATTIAWSAGSIVGTTGWRVRTGGMAVIPIVMAVAGAMGTDNRERRLRWHQVRARTQRPESHHVRRRLEATCNQAALLAGPALTVRLQRHKARTAPVVGNRCVK